MACPMCHEMLLRTQTLFHFSGRSGICIFKLGTWVSDISVHMNYDTALVTKAWDGHKVYWNSRKLAVRQVFMTSNLIQMQSKWKQRNEFHAAAVLAGLSHSKRLSHHTEPKNIARSDITKLKIRVKDKVNGCCRVTCYVTDCFLNVIISPMRMGNVGVELYLTEQDLRPVL